MRNMRAQRNSLADILDYRKSKSTTKRRLDQSLNRRVNRSDSHIDKAEFTVDSKIMKQKDSITIGSLIWLHKKMKNLKEAKHKKNEMRLMLREKNKTKCPELLERISKRLGSLSTYALNEEETYEKQLKRLNEFYTRLHLQGTQSRNARQTEKIVLMKSFIHFKKRFSYNLTKMKFVKRLIKSYKEDSFLFIFYKSDKDVDIHISLEENVKFKGLIFRNINLSEIDCVFYKRHYDFSCRGYPKHKRLYISLTFEQPCKLNVCFKANIRDPSQTVEQKIEFKRRREMLVNQPVDRHFHKEIIKKVENINLYRGLKKKYKFLEKRTTILNRNRRAASTFRRDKKIKKSVDRVRARKRVQSAKINRAVQERKRLAKCSKNIFRKELKEIQGMIRDEYYYRLSMITGWVKFIKCCSALAEIYTRFRRRINQIQRFEGMAANARSNKDIFLHPEMLDIPSGYRSEFMDQFLRKKASLYVGLMLNKIQMSNQIKIRFIRLKMKCLKCLSRFQRHVEIKKTSVRKAVKFLTKEINESAFWQQYFDSGLAKKKNFKISEHLDIFTPEFIQELADLFVNYDMLRHSFWLLSVRKSEVLELTIAKNENPKRLEYCLVKVEESLKLKYPQLFRVVSLAYRMHHYYLDKGLEDKKGMEFYREYYPNYPKYLIRALVFSKCYNEVNVYPEIPSDEPSESKE